MMTRSIAQAFAHWISPKWSGTSDPFLQGNQLQASRKTYQVTASDRLCVEFTNDKGVKATLPRAIIEEWANYIERNGIDETYDAQKLRDAVKKQSRFSGLLHHWETHYKPAAFALLKARDTNPVTARRYEIVSVGADWTSNENILGYPNGLDAESYQSTAALELILRAKEDSDHPHFLILDEMNLSHVERYFADLLSAIESGEQIPLHSGGPRRSGDRAVPHSVTVPDNLFIVGTVNIDETTYMFSPKVLDRANVLEFRMTSAELSAFLNDPLKPNLHKIGGEGATYGKQFVDAARVSTEMPKRWSGDQGLFSVEMKLFFDVLGGHGAEFGFRVAHEAARFVSLFHELTGASGDVSMDDAFDCVIVQKFLPKLHGSRAKLGPLLKSLWFFCTKKHSDRGDNAMESSQQAARSSDKDAEPSVAVPAHAPYPLSAHKIGRMWRLLNENGYVSFAEA